MTNPVDHAAVRRARKREKEARWQARLLRRQRKAEVYRGHISEIDPTTGMADRQPPPMLGSVARIIGEIG